MEVRIGEEGLHDTLCCVHSPSTYQDHVENQCIACKQQVCHNPALRRLSSPQVGIHTDLAYS